MKRFWLWIAVPVLLAGAGQKSVTVQSSQVPWKALEIPGFPPGLQGRALPANPDGKLMTSIVRYPKGYREPRHYHTMCGHSIYVLRGRMRSPEGDMVAGSFIYSAVNERHGPFQAVEETEILFYTDGPFDMHIDDPKAPGAGKR